MTPDRYVLPGRAAVDRLRVAVAGTMALYEVRRDAGDAAWRRVCGTTPFDWDAPLPLSGAKRFFFPPREPLLSWRGDTPEAVLPAVEPFALFGMRACDAAAVAYLDRFFAGDPFYELRRERALLVGVNCLAACPGGFCAQVGAGPFVHAGCDLVLTPLDDARVLVEIASGRGAGVFRAACPEARPASDGDAAAYDEAEGRARQTFAAPGRDGVLQRAIGRVDAGSVTDAEWQAFGPACFACTGCTNVCPTCSCFAVVDEPSDGGGVRTREWDSCLLEGFQREASGHHPAPRPGDRVRRFWYHKLSRDFEARCGRVGCVGCGRCDVTCPGSIGALRVLGTLGAP